MPNRAAPLGLLSFLLRKKTKKRSWKNKPLRVFEGLRAKIREEVLALNLRSFPVRHRSPPFHLRISINGINVRKKTWSKVKCKSTNTAHFGGDLPWYYQFNGLEKSCLISLCIFTIQGVPILILLCIQYRVGTSCSIRVSMHALQGYWIWLSLQPKWEKEDPRWQWNPNSLKKAIFNYILILLSDSSIYDERTISKPHEC